MKWFNKLPLKRNCFSHIVTGNETLSIANHKHPKSNLGNLQKKVALSGWALSPVGTADTQAGAQMTNFHFTSAHPGERIQKKGGQLAAAHHRFNSRP